MVAPSIIWLHSLVASFKKKQAFPRHWTCLAPSSWTFISLESRAMIYIVYKYPIRLSLFWWSMWTCQSSNFRTSFPTLLWLSTFNRYYIKLYKEHQKKPQNSELNSWLFYYKFPCPASTFSLQSTILGKGLHSWGMALHYLDSKFLSPCSLESTTPTALPWIINLQLDTRSLPAPPLSFSAFPISPKLNGIEFNHPYELSVCEHSSNKFIDVL